MSPLTERQKISHLYRRLGFGISAEELRDAEKVGLEATIRHLIDYDAIDEGFPVSPWEFCIDEGSKDFYFDAYRTASYWSARMAMTRRPLQEKLTLFWHDHFAISAAKVELGPMLLSYVETMRTHAMGKFSDLTLAVAKEPAMLFWLDTWLSEKGRPNENFARELFELFTLGIGAYTEKDVRESARAFTGWGIRYLLYEQGGEKVMEVGRECAKSGRPMTTFCSSPELHDAGPKTILGETKEWDGDQVIEMACRRPETARYLAKKLWEFFVYEAPDKAIVEAIAKAFRDADGSIRATLYAIVRRPEFFSERAYRQRVKCPIEFNTAIVRQLGVGPYLLAEHGPKPTPQRPAPKPLRDIAGAIFGLSLQQGMQLLFPPSVAGWDWGKAWITTTSAMQRLKLGDLLMGTDSGDKGGATALLARISQPNVPATDAALVESALRVFDAEPTPELSAALLEVASRRGGAHALQNVQSAAPMFADMCRLIFSSPEFQMC